MKNMLEKPTKVFIDANILISAGKPPGGPMLLPLKNLVDAGVITVLTTDLTCQEVAKKHARNDYNVIKGVGRPHFRKLVEDVLGTNLPNITSNDLKAQLTGIYQQSTEQMFKDLKCKTLAIDNVKPSIVFSDYATSKGFFTDEGKKDQFPDAFIFECLKSEASSDQPVIIVSNDSDFEKPAESEVDISLVKSIPDLLESLGLKDDGPDVEEFLELYNEELIEAIDDELDDWWLIGDVMDSEIEETNVTMVEAMELTSFSSTEEGGPILVIGRISIVANVSYTHPDWDGASYDSEDKVLIPFRDVIGETEVGIDVDVSLLLTVDEFGDPQYIKELSFTNDDFQYIELHPNDTYKWY